MYDFSFGIVDLIRKHRSAETSFLKIRLFEITGQPGALDTSEARDFPKFPSFFVLIREML